MVYQRSSITRLNYLTMKIAVIIIRPTKWSLQLKACFAHHHNEYDLLFHVSICNFVDRWKYVWTHLPFPWVPANGNPNFLNCQPNHSSLIHHQHYNSMEQLNRTTWQSSLESMSMYTTLSRVKLLFQWVKITFSVS